MALKSETRNLLQNMIAWLVNNADGKSPIETAAYIRECLAEIENIEKLSYVDVLFGKAYAYTAHIKEETCEKKKTSMDVLMYAMTKMNIMVIEKSSPTEIIQETRKKLDEAEKIRKDELCDEEKEKKAAKRINEISQNIGEMMNEGKTNAQILHYVNVASGMD